MFVVASPYSEASVLAIARAAFQAGALEHYYTTFATGEWLTILAQMLPNAVGRGARAKAGRLTAGLPTSRVRTVAQLAELRHLTSRRLPGAQRAAARLMYSSKADFDFAVARSLTSVKFEAVVSMYASACETLVKGRQMGRKTVLNFVNSHPKYHNSYLLQLAGLAATSHELVPRDVAERIERELEAADIVLSPSRFVAAQLRDLGFPGDRIALIPYGVDSDTFKPALAKPASSTLRCIYIGQISYRKGVHCLLAAAHQLARVPVTFDLYGPLVSPEILKNLPANARWRPTVGHDSLSRLMAAADVVIVPSLEDAYPLVTLEAMACGLVPIVSTNAGTAELISDGTNGMLVPAADIERLRNSVLRLVEDRPLRLNMAHEALQTAQTLPSWKDYGRQVLDRIGQDLSERRRLVAAARATAAANS